MADQPKSPEKQQLDNHAVQLNRNSDAFWQARGYPARPPDWEARNPSLPPRSANGARPVKK